MRPFKKCSTCGLISKDEICLDIPAFAYLINPTEVCRCSLEAEAKRQESARVVTPLQGMQLIKDTTP